jgi:transcriptional regulator NrdR family protein
VKDIRRTVGSDGTWRQRECLDCGHRFPTEERVAEYARAEYPPKKSAHS